MRIDIRPYGGIPHFSGGSVPVLLLQSNPCVEEIHVLRKRKGGYSQHLTKGVFDTSSGVC
jgi:hypothetical protein